MSLGEEAGEFTGAKEDAGEHGAIKPAGVGVAQRRVVAREELEAVREVVFDAVAEVVERTAGDDALVEEVSEVAVEGDLAESDDDADAGKEVDLAGEMGGAVADFEGRGFVAGRGAADDGGDPGVAELEAVCAGGGVRLIGEADFVEDGVHEVAGAVAGEGAASAVGAVRSRGEADDEDAGAGVAEAGDGTCPVDLVLVGAASGDADSGTVLAEAGASLAGADLGVDLGEGGKW